MRMSSHRKTHKRANLGCGIDSKSGETLSGLSTTASLTTSQKAKESNSWEPLPCLCVGQGFQD